MPLKGVISPTIVFKKVVLPIPFLPTKAVLVPRSNSISETFNKIVSLSFSIKQTFASWVFKITLTVLLVFR